MQVDFVISAGGEGQTFSVEKKVGTLLKAYKPRSVQISSDSLQYINESDGKGADDLVGASILAAPNGTSEIKLKLKEKKEHVLFRAKNSFEAEMFVNQVRKAIRRANVHALQNGRNDAEVVEWYYQYQADLAKEASFMGNKYVVHMYHPLPGQTEIRKSYFIVTMPSDRSGLLFTLDRAAAAGAGHPTSRLASLYNGRIVPFTDITGVFLPGGKFEHDNEGGLQFVLHTREDELSLYLPARGVEWLRAVQAMCIFSRVPAPSSRTLSPTSEQSLAAFSANSGAVFSPSSDVLLILRQLADKPGQSPATLALCEAISGVLRALPDVRCHREAMLVLGGRMEDVVRVLGAADTGVLSHVKEDQREAVDAKVFALKEAFEKIRAYLKVLRYAGWLKSSLESTTNAKANLEALDAGVMTVMNKKIDLLKLDSALMFERRDYVCAADVRKEVENLGGVAVIYQDTVKERTLAKLIQADPAEVARELAQMHGVERSASQKSQHSSFTGMENSNNSSDSSSAARGCWYYFLCCPLWSCCCPSAAQSADKPASKAAPTPSLREPLVA